MKLAEGAKDATVREAAHALLGNMLTSGETYSRDEIERIREQSQCRATSSVTLPRKGGECLRLTARVTGNGLNVLVIEPDALDGGR